jgi:hypothetical protein
LGVSLGELVDQGVDIRKLLGRFGLRIFSNTANTKVTDLEDFRERKTAKGIGSDQTPKST